MLRRSITSAADSKILDTEGEIETKFDLFLTIIAAPLFHDLDPRTTRDVGFSVDRYHRKNEESSAHAARCRQVAEIYFWSEMVRSIEGYVSGGSKPVQKTEHLDRGLSNRHLQLISIGGAIGVGLFMGSGKTISLSGTSIILTYAVIGFFMYFLMRALGELLLSNLGYKTFADFCTEYLGAWAGFSVAWSYWLAWVVAVISDCIIVGGYARFWFPDLPTWIPAFVTLATLMVLNAMTVKVFGEIEFWFAITKIIAIAALIVASGYLIATSYVSPSGVTASLDHLFRHDAFMPHGMAGVFAGFQIAIFSFAGLEVIGTTAAETRDPEKNLPKAINSVPIRILVFYVLSLACIISVSSLSGIDASKSPFVQLFALAGFPMAAGAVNLVVTLSAMSSANSGVYSTSRMLYGLAIKNDAPKWFLALNRQSIPMRSLIYSCGCMLSGVVVLLFVPDVMSAFTLVSTVCAILFIYVWSMILLAYLAYRRKRPDLHDRSVFKMPGGTWTSVLCLAFFAFVMVLLGLRPDTLQALLVTPIWFAFLGLTFKFKR